MKKIVLMFAMILAIGCVSLTGCRQANRASWNLSKEADNFNVVRQITVINCIQGDVLFQMTGKMSIHADTDDDQLEVIVEDNGVYTKHFVGLSDNVTYVVEDLDMGANDVSQYHYQINFNPKMWLPLSGDYTD